MALNFRNTKGFSFIELLVVFAIVGVLAVVGFRMIGDRRGGGVRSVVDELEGVLLAAQKSSIASNRDIYISASGEWLNGTLVLDGRPLSTATSNPPVAADLVPGVDTKRVGASSECFRAQPNTRSHMNAGVAVGNDSWYTTALGASPALSGVPPISGQADFINALANPLFKSGGAVTTVVVNGQNKRFMTGFSIVVVGLSGGVPLQDSPIGILVVPQNSSSVYKFYKGDRSNVWRKI